MADWVQQAGSLDVAAGDYFGTGQLKTHADGVFGEAPVEPYNPGLA
jgi:hypothetical protein